ncbi:hypothetical protein SAMN05216266_1486 [Amycolatopsis marina]|uniref:Glycosyl transferase n=1 Tax=Amycolatopsis marina TaxID=490629 RepID=A0A1I1CQ84_9PSEU|nr:glycosyl transferase [Amycolatopsis marina]SFB64811.1 hypothetical protein SAMN05216266_1486 [Amycolatopsis marina]
MLTTTMGRTAVPTATTRSHCRPADWIMAAGSVFASFLIFRPLWTAGPRTYLTSSGQDQNMWEWFFAVTADAVFSGANPLFTELQNVPAGVNLMSNTVMLGMGVPLAPVTAVFGPSVTWALVLTGGLAGSAFAWYWLLSRWVVSSSCAAVLGGMFCGFAPPIVSHANAHPNFVVLFVLPLMVVQLLRLAHGARPSRAGTILGLLAVWQVFLGEEPLLIAALALVLFASAYALSRPQQVATMAAPVARGLAVAAAVCVPLVAFPLWWQFFGPQSYRSLEHGPSGNDAAAFTAFATESVAGVPGAAGELSLNRTEENAFFGWPLMLLLAVLTLALWRDAVARAAAVAMWLLAWISTGIVLFVAGTGTGVGGPWLGMFRLPLLESVLESRFALGCVPFIGILLARATQHVLAAGTASGSAHLPLRYVWAAALVLTLLPAAPTELRTHQRPEIPRFFASGIWQSYVDPGGSVVFAPLPDTGDAEPLHWQVSTELRFPIAEGYFVAPHGPDRSGNYGAQRRPTSWLLERITRTGVAPHIGLADRLRAQADLRFWRADVVVLVPRRHQDELRLTVERLVGSPGRVVGGVWVWDVRALVR